MTNQIVTDKKRVYGMYGALRNGLDAKEWLKCHQDCDYFITKYLKISHPKYGLIPFELYKYQRAVLWAFLFKRYVITLKPRQMGLSTIVCAYALWLCLFHDFKEVRIVSIKKSTATSMLRRIKLMYKHIPDYLKVDVTNGKSAMDMGTQTEMFFANGSSIIALPASEDAGRSDALSLLILDEVAFQRHASAIWGSSQQTLSTGGSCIMISTAFGMGNLFHNTWVGAVTNTNGFFPVKLDWRMHPDRTIEWYEENKKLLGAKRTAQEIDCDFLSSGYNVFNLEKIKAIDDRLMETPVLEEWFGGAVKFYHAYDNTRSYVVGADVATGRSRDYSTFSVMDEYGKEYACGKIQCTISEFASILARVGYKYGTAVLAPEANSIGEGVTAHLQEMQYPKIYFGYALTMKLDAFERDRSLIAGWLTTGKTRHEIITELDNDLEHDMVEINNPFFTQEAYSFIYDEHNKPIAAGKKSKKTALLDDFEDTVAFTDDAVFGECITNRVRKDPHFMQGGLPIWGGN